MARSEAEGREPTIDEINTAAAQQFKGFATTDGVVSDGKATPEEQAALTARAQQQRQSQRAMNGGAPSLTTGDEDEDDTENNEGGEGEENANETPEEKTAREQREAGMTDKQKASAALQKKVGGKDDKGKGGDKHRSANERIGQAVGKQRAAERALDEERGRFAAKEAEWERRLAAIENRPPLTADGKPVTQVDKDAPRATDYQYGELDSAYIRDLAVYETRKAIAQENQQRNATATTAAQRQAAADLKVKSDKFAEAGAELYDDFDETVVQTARQGDWDLSKTFGDLMFDSPEGPHIAYYLATHPKEAKRIMGLSDPAQAAAFGRLEAAFSSPSSDATTQNNDTQEKPGQGEPKVPVKTATGNTTKVPPPPKHQARGAGGKTQVGADTTDFAAFERMANAS